MLQIDFNKLDAAPLNEKDMISEFEWLFDGGDCLYGPKRMVVGFIEAHPVLLQWEFDNNYVCISPTGRTLSPELFFNTIQERIDDMNRDAFQYGGIVGKVIRDTERDLNHVVRFYHYDLEDDAGAIVEITV